MNHNLLFIFDVVVSGFSGAIGPFTVHFKRR